MKNVLFLIALIISGLITAQEPFSLNYNHQSFGSYLCGTSATGNKHAVVNMVYGELTNSYVISLIEDGAPRWNKKLELENDFPNTIQARIDPSTGNLVGFYNYMTNSGAFIKVFKLSYSTGEVLWSKNVSIPFLDNSFGGSFYENRCSFSINENGHIQISFGLYDHLRFIELTTNGNLVYSKKINNIDLNIAKNPGFCLNQCPDGSYLVSLKDDNWPTIALLNPDFSVAWSQKWSFESYSHPKVIQRLNSGKIVVTGYGDYGLFVALLNADGTMIKYLRSDTNQFLSGAISVHELDENRLLLGTDYSDYIIVNLTTNQWKWYQLQHTIRFNPGGQGISAILEGYLINGSVQVIPNFDPENSECLVVENILEGNLVDATSLNAIEHNIPFYFKNNGEITDASLNLSDFPVTNGFSCILGTNNPTLTTVSLSPNPINRGEEITLELNQPFNDGLVRISDLTGKVLHQQSFTGTEFSVETDGLNSGLYLVQLFDKSGQLIDSKRVVVK